MPLKTPKGLFLYQMGTQRAAELAGVNLLNLLKGRVQNGELAQTLDELTRDKQHQVNNIKSCMDIVDGSPLETPAPAVGGLRERFELFARMQPAPEILDLFALDVALRLKYLGIVAYQEVIDLGNLLGEDACQQFLQDNLKRKQQNAARLEKLRDKMHRQLFATV
ncbi:MAG TPA: DUF892 family protein [Micromonosporaceae bacterium]|nr:DUF892 family protein [Micromonosporaceae bacterium]